MADAATEPRTTADEMRPQPGPRPEARAPGAAPSPSQTAAPNGASVQARPRVSPRTRVILLTVLLVALVAAAVYGFNWWTTGRFLQTTNDAYLRADQVTVAPKVSGYVTDVFVRDNQDVAAGQPLVKIDERTYRAALAQAQADIDARMADIARANAATTQQLATIQGTEAQLAGAKTAAAYAESEVRRYAPLAASGAETAERFSQVKNTRDQAEATVKGDEAAVEAAQRDLGTLKAGVGQAEAQLEAARASAHEQELNLADTLVRSSIAGRVGDKTVRVGQFVQPGTRMMSVVPVEDLYLVANFKETQIGLMRIGQPVTVRVDALGGAVLHGRVESFSPGTGAQFALLPPENATGNFTKVVQRVPVRIHLDVNGDVRQVLVPGLSATVTVDTRGARQDAPRLRREANS